MNNFNPEYQCRECSLSFIFSLLGLQNISNNEIERANSAIKIMELFKTHNIGSKLYTGTFTHIVMKLLYPHTIVLPKKAFSSNESCTFATLFFATSYQFYKINEHWSHFIVEYHEGKKYYDPYAEYLECNYPAHKNIKWTSDQLRKKSLFFITINV